MKGRVLFNCLAALTAAALLTAPYLVFRVAPVEPVQGWIQKLFYFHVPCAWAMLLAAVLSAIGGAAYLFRRRQWGDELCAAAGELSAVFGSLVLITGPLWGRRAWGHYWVWDVRLTTSLILFLVFLAVLLARRFGGPSRKLIAAGLALFGAVDVPLIYLSVRLWRTIHPETSVVSSLSPGMLTPFLVSLTAFTLLLVLLLWIRLNLERARHQLDDLACALAERD